MLKINGKLSVVLAYAGSLFSLAALLVFKILPTSDFANSIEHSGMDAVWVLTICPVFALLGAVCFMISFLKDYKAWQDFTTAKPLITGAAIACAVFFILNLYVYFSYYFNQVSLGFVAPYDGTIYKTYEIFVTVITVNQFILSTIAAIAIKRNNK